MCIAILNTKGLLTKETLKTCWTNNPDGAGMIYVTDKNALVTFKELNSFDRFYKEYSKQRKLNKDSNFVLHFRIATSGKIDLNNCHPFKVSKDLAFVHNGMIDIEQVTKDFSDTYSFNQTILKELGKNFLYNEAIVRLIEGYIGYSKLVFLNNFNEATIINELLGSWDGANWYSNDSYKPRATKKYEHYGYGYYSKGYNNANTCDLCETKGAIWNDKHHSYLCASCEDYYKTTSEHSKLSASNNDLWDNWEQNFD